MLHTYQTREAQTLQSTQVNDSKDNYEGFCIFANYVYAQVRYQYHFLYSSHPSEIEDCSATPSSLSTSLVVSGSFVPEMYKYKSRPKLLHLVVLRSQSYGYLPSQL